MKPMKPTIGIIQTVALLLALFASAVVHADDTEIYYGESKGKGNVNLMFMLDTSGSMNWCERNSSVPGDYDCTTDKVRLNVLKTSFGQLLDGMDPSIRVGLGAFSGSRVGNTGGGDTGHGGYVIYPAERLGDFAEQAKAMSSVQNQDDDGFQYSWQNNAVNNTSTLLFPSQLAGNGLGIEPVKSRTGFIFRQLGVPSYARVAKATMTVTSAVALNIDLKMDGYYAIGPEQPLPSLADQGLNNGDRDWGPREDGELDPDTIEVEGSFGLRQPTNIDVTDLVQSAINNESWCGGDDLLLGFELQGTYPLDFNWWIGAHGVITDSKFLGSILKPLKVIPPAASIEVEWDVNSSMPAAAKSCMGGLTNDGNVDAEEGNNGQVVLNGNQISLQKNNSIMGVRFADLVTSGSQAEFKQATLHLPGDGSERKSTKQICQYNSSGLIGIGGGWTGSIKAKYCQGTPYKRCGFWGNGACDTRWHDEETFSTVPAATEVKLKLDVVAANSAISSSNGNISQRTSLKSETVKVSAEDFRAGHVLDLDVTDLLKDINPRNVMFRISVPSAGENDRFMVKTSESGQGASLTFQLAAASQGDFGGKTVRDQLKEAVNNLDADGGTPLSESYTEMARYFLGNATYFGNGKKYGYGRNSVTHAKSSKLSVVDGDIKGDYQSPLEGTNQTCSANSIILMTDGRANSDAGTPEQISQITNGAVNCGSLSDNLANRGLNLYPDDYACMAKFAKWLNNKNASGKRLKRQVTTNLVGFYLDKDTEQQMRRVSDKGQGVTLFANSADELLGAFQDIVRKVMASNASMAAPGVAVNQLNRFQHLNELYYGVFRPKNVGSWPGNLKKYSLGGNDQSPEIQGKNGVMATDPNSGFFRDDAVSYWSDTIDGPDVSEGGAFEQSQRQGAARQLFITSATASNGSNPLATSAGAVALTAVQSASDLQSSALGLPSNVSESQRQRVVNWLATAWGDPLHSEPQLVNYGFSGTAEEAAKDPSKQKNVVYYSDNDGLLHAINAANGHELFAFMPAEELLKAGKRATQGQTNALPSDHSRGDYYGLDSTWTFWRQGDGSGGVSSVYAYAGQRRGGSSYYALDVTDPGFDGSPTPKLLWQISQQGTGPFSLLGQTWSQPQLAKIKINGLDVPVLVFGGGYDANSNDTDGVVNAQGDSVGNALYMVNAYTGALIWYASSTTAGGSGTAFTAVTDMKWSIPAAPAVVDANGDGYADFIYAGDMGGQLFRVSLDSVNNIGTGSLVKGVKTLAKLGVSGAGTDAVNNRRFYASPVVALGERNDTRLLKVVAGSGYRAHPLSETTQEGFYAIDDIDALPILQAVTQGDTVEATQSTLLASDLLDVTQLAHDAKVVIDDGNGEGTHYYGWRLELDKGFGEKSLSEAAVVQGKVIFSTFTNRKANSNTCSTVIGGARAYVINLEDGLAAAFFEPDEVLGGTYGRATEVNVPGIPPKPQVLLTNLPNKDPASPGDPQCGFQGGDMTLLLGTLAKNLGKVDNCGLVRTRWYESSKQETDEMFENGSDQ